MCVCECGSVSVCVCECVFLRVSVCVSVSVCECVSLFVLVMWISCISASTAFHFTGGAILQIYICTSSLIIMVPPENTAF